MMGECNCARMPVQNPFGRVGLFLSAFLVWFVQLISSLPLVSQQVFSLIQPDILAFLYLVFFCVVITVLCL